MPQLRRLLACHPLPLPLTACPLTGSLSRTLGPWRLQSRHDGDEPGEGDDIAAFALEASELHRPLRRWIAHQLQDARRSSAPLAQEPNDETPGGAAPDDYFALVPPECHDLMEGGHYAEALAAVDASGSYGPPPDAMLEDIVLGLLFGARVPSPRPSPARPGFGSFTTSRGDVSRDDAALSWQCVMRTADKARTAALIWRFMLHWELQVRAQLGNMFTSYVCRAWRGNGFAPFWWSAAKHSLVCHLIRQLHAYARTALPSLARNGPLAALPIRKLLRRL